MRWQTLPLLALTLVSFAKAAPPANWPDIVHPPAAADRAAIVANGWANSRDAIASALAQNYRPGNSVSPGSTGQATYQLWLLQWKWCDLLSRNEMDEAKRFIALHSYFDVNTKKAILIPPGSQGRPGAPPVPDDTIAKLVANPKLGGISLPGLLNADSLPFKDETLASILPPDAQKEWTTDDDFLRLFFANLSPEDYTPEVLRNLAAIYAAQPAKFREYHALAIAIAVVYDQKLPANWPHSQVPQADVLREDHSPADWFAFWVKSNETRACLYDLRKLSPEQLKFVVDAPLPESEYEWARKNVPHQQGDFDQTFFDIQYVNSRATKNIMNWPGADYTLANIKSQGGICVDQAYYASICGKARGLPTLYFSGQGKDGGHAWFGYLKNMETWALDCGRYANQNFVVGYAYDPQTWTNITDHQLSLLTEHFRSLPAYTASRDDVVIAGIFVALGDNTKAARALDSALAVCPKNSDAWDAKTDFLVRSGAPVATLRAHHMAAIRQFSGQPDLLTAHQNALADLAADEGDANTANTIRREIADQNQGARVDLTIATVAQKIGDEIKARNFSGAYAEYQNQLPVLGPKGGGDFFNKISRPLIIALHNAGNTTDARSAIDLTRKTLNPGKDTILENEIKQLEDQVNGTSTAKKATTPTN